MTINKLLKTLIFKSDAVQSAGHRIVRKINVLVNYEYRLGQDRLGKDKTGQNRTGHDRSEDDQKSGKVRAKRSRHIKDV